jgi:crotonobetainyl-CoA:carnitine CoA-transferase CaiB-like acyl-CoA transferase
VTHRAELEAILERTIGAMDREPLLKALEAAGVPATPVNTVDQVMEDPQTAARGMVDRVEHPVLGEIPVVSTPVKFSAMRAGVRTPAPVRGQHTDAVLKDLGYTAEEVTGLREKNVVA